MPALANADVARVLATLATMLELDGANVFRVRAYREAARVVESLPEPVAKLAAAAGGLETMTRPEAQKRAEDAGARTASAISRKVTLVVAGPGAGSKLDEAKKLKLEVIDEAEFLKRVGGT